jgi:hypothetical protein
MEKDDRRGGIYKGEALNSACKWSGPNPTLLNNEQVIPLRHGLLPVHIYIYIYREREREREREYNVEVRCSITRVVQ